MSAQNHMQGNPKSRKKFGSLLAPLSTQKKEKKKHKLTHMSFASNFVLHVGIFSELFFTCNM
jgi:hypothetical protein